MIRAIAISAALSVILSTSVWTFAGECQGGKNCGCHVQCPSCRSYCELKIEPGKEKKSCWEVECKPICIPQITFPWQKCSEPKCAKVKYIHVLKKHEYECDVCKHKWEAVCDKCGEGTGKSAPPTASRDESTPAMPPPVTIHSPGEYYGRSAPNFADPPTPIGLERRGFPFGANTSTMTSGNTPRSR
jgi:hypothetical protein